MPPRHFKPPQARDRKDLCTCRTSAVAIAAGQHGQHAWQQPTPSACRQTPAACLQSSRQEEGQKDLDSPFRPSSYPHLFPRQEQEGQKTRQKTLLHGQTGQSRHETGRLGRLYTLTATLPYHASWGGGRLFFLPQAFFSVNMFALSRHLGCFCDIFVCDSCFPGMGGCFSLLAFYLAFHLRALSVGTELFCFQACFFKVSSFLMLSSDFP